MIFKQEREVIPVLTVVGSHADEVVGIHIVNDGRLVSSSLGI